MVVLNCAKRLSRDSRARQSYFSSQYLQTSCAYESGKPCDQSSTHSRSGHRVVRKRRFKSSSSASVTEIRNGVISLLILSLRLRDDLSRKSDQSRNDLSMSSGPTFSEVHQKADATTRAQSG